MTDRPINYNDLRPLLPLTARSQVRYFGILGDSRMAQGQGNSSQGLSNRGVQHHLTFMSKGRFQFPSSLMKALGSRRVQGGGNDVLTTLDADIATMVAAGASGVLFMCSYNDIATGSSYASIIAGLTTIRNKLNAAGLALLVFIDIPCGGTYLFNAAKFAIACGVRNWWLNQRGAPGLAVFDTWPDWIDPTSAFGAPRTDRQDLFWDTYLHLSYKGARRLANLALSTMYAMWPSAQAQELWSDTDVYDATSNPNGPVVPAGAVSPMCSGTGGSITATNGSGVVATGLKLVHFNDMTGLTAVASKDFMDDGRPCQKVVISGTAASVAPTVAPTYTFQNTAVIAVVAGQRYRHKLSVEWDAGVSGVNCISQVVSGAAQAVGMGLFGDVGAFLTPEKDGGLYISDDYNITTTTSLARLNVQAIPGATVNLTMRFTGWGYDRLA